MVSYVANKINNFINIYTKEQETIINIDCKLIFCKSELLYSYTFAMYLSFTAAVLITKSFMKDMKIFTIILAKIGFIMCSIALTLLFQYYS